MPFLPVSIPLPERYSGMPNTWLVSATDIIIPANELSCLTAEQVGEHVLAIARYIDTYGVIISSYLRKETLGYDIHTFEELQETIEKYLSTPSVSLKQKATNRVRGKVSSHYDVIFLAIGRRDGFHCHECRATEDLEIDHYNPVSNGGESTIENLQLLCGPCNRKKAGKSPPS